MDLEHIVIENIKRIRREKHISQEKLAEYCNTSASYIGLMETYKNIPKLSTIERIAEALNVPVLELFAISSVSAEKIKSRKDLDIENNRKQKMREHIKKEVLEQMSNKLDEILQIL